MSCKTATRAIGREEWEGCKSTYRAGDQDGTRPVAAEFGVSGVGSELPLGEGVCGGLLRAREVSTRSTAGDTLSEALLRSGDGERRSDEKELSEEGGAEHDGR